MGATAVAVLGSGVSVKPHPSRLHRAHYGHSVRVFEHSWTVAGCGFVIGDVLAQSITGGQLDALRSVQLGVVGSVLDVFRQEAAKEDSKVGRAAATTAAAAQEVKNNLVWAPIVTCAIYAALKLVEGNPQEIVQGVEVSRSPPHGVDHPTSLQLPYHAVFCWVLGFTRMIAANHH